MPHAVLTVRHSWRSRVTMIRDILVTLLEDDVFSRNWMALLLVRDWRTRLIAEFTNQVELCQYINENSQPFDVLIMDVDLFGETFTVHEICENLNDRHLSTKILLTGVQADSRIFHQQHSEQVAGYVLKGEVGYSLSWVISFAADGYFILTPGTMSLASRMNYSLPHDRMILDGRRSIPGFTDHESEVARLAFIFSLGRRDLADELKISEQWSYGLVSELYKKMGLGEILSGEVDLFSYIPENPIIRKHFTTILEEMGTSTKARDMETLAYHLLTMPEILT